MLSISDNYNIVFDKTPMFSKHKAEYEIYVIGELLGYVDTEKVIEDNSIVVEQICLNWNNDKALEKLLSWCIGKFIVIIYTRKEKKIILYNSVIGPGFFYYKIANKLYITNDEKKIASHCLNDGLNEMELIHSICTEQSPPSSPYTSLYNICKRVPGGTRAVIQQNLDLSHKNYLISSEVKLGESDKDNYKTFKWIFENTCSILCKKNNNKKIFSTLSGGIDSSVIYLASLKNYHNVFPYHWRKSDILTTTIDLFCNSINSENPIYAGHNYCTADSEKVDIDKAISFYSKSSGIIGIGNMYLPFKGTQAAYLTGIGFGCVIQTNGFMRPNFGESLLYRHYQDTVKKKPLRFMFTKTFLDIVNKDKNTNYEKILKKLVSPKGYKLPNNVYQYLLFLLITNKLPCCPERVLPSALEQYEDGYIKYIEGNILHPLIGKSSDLIMYQKEIKNLEFDKIKRLSRLIRYVVQVQRASLQDSFYENAGNFKLLTPAIEGPVVNFFLNMPLSLTDVLKSKRYLFRYFTEEAGYTYENLLNQVRKQKYKMPLKKYLETIKRKLKIIKSDTEGKSHKEILVSSYRFKNDFIPFLNTDKSSLLPLIKDIKLRDFVYTLYKDINSGTLNNFRVINQLLNLEIFISNLDN